MKGWKMVPALLLLVCLAVTMTPYQHMLVTLGEGGYVLVTFDVEGLGDEFSGAILVVDGVDYAASDLPYTFNWTENSTHSYCWYSPLYSSKYKYEFQNCSGLATSQSGSITATENGNVTATYVHTATYIEFHISGIPPEYEYLDYILTIDDQDYTVQDVATGLKFLWNVSSIHEYTYASSVRQANSYRVYACSHVEANGVEVPLSSAIQVNQYMNFTGFYGWGNRTVTFDVKGLPENATFTAILQVDDLLYSSSDLPVTFEWEFGSQHSFEWASEVSAEVEDQTVTYRWVYSTSTGTHTERSETFRVEASENITAHYIQSAIWENPPAPTGWGSLEIGDGTGSTATHFPAQNHIFYAKGKYWCFYVNEEGIFGYKTFSPGGSLSEFTPIRVTYENKIYDVFSGDGKYAVAFYEPEREYVHIALFPGTIGGQITRREVWYRLGALCDDGSISWVADWDYIEGLKPYQGDENFYAIDLAVDTDGYPFLAVWGYLYQSGAKKAIIVARSGTNDGQFTVAEHKVAAYIALTQHTWASIVRLKEKRMLLVMYYFYTTYRLQSRLFDGSWSSKSNIVPENSDPLMVSASSLSLSAYENTAVLSYLHSDGIHLHRYVYGQGWSSACIIESDSISTESYPAVTMLNSETAEVFWGYESAIFRAEYNCTANSVSEAEMIYVQDSLDATSLNALPYRSDNRAGVLYVHQQEVESAKVHLLMFPYAGVAPGFVFPVVPLLGFVGILLVIISPTMLVRAAKNKDWDQIATWVCMLLLGFSFVIAWATSGVV